MKKHSKYRILTIFLQTIIGLVGLGVLIFLLWEPHVEGINAQASFFEVYLDPFVVLVYAGSVPFFVALYKALKILGYIKHGKAFSIKTVKALQTIKYCAFITAGFVVTVASYIKIASLSSQDDPAGFIALSIIVTFASLIVGATAAVFQRTLQRAVKMKSENDLTV